MRQFATEFLDIVHKLISIRYIIYEVNGMCNKGIYKLTIGNKSYIGKDVKIDSNVRYSTHKNLLVKEKHYNKYLQHAYNKYGKLTYEVLVTGDFTKEELAGLEIFYIDKYNTFERGYNLTKGGEGMLGAIRTDDFKQQMSLRMSNDNPMGKINKDQFNKLVSMLLEGHTNSEIANETGLHSRYISLIRHKKRHKLWWEEIGNPNIESSKGKYRITKLDLFSILEELDNHTNLYIGTKYGIDKSTVSRIRNKKLYKDWITEYEKQGQRLSKG